MRIVCCDVAYGGSVPWVGGLGGGAPRVGAEEEEEEDDEEKRGE